jgi:Na+/H+ antiporter NhaA
MNARGNTVGSGERTAWRRSVAAPVRDFLSTETGGALVMLAATVAALGWANLSPGSYESAWSTQFGVHLGSAGISTDLRHWVNEGLMTLFFLVIGLEAKRELDLGELRDRRRLAIPALAAAGGIVVPVAIYLAFNGGGAGAHGWGAAMSTDTAFALGALALLTPRAATRIRVFLLTLAVVDDLTALLVIATVYTTHLSVMALVIAVALFGVLIGLRYLPIGRGAVSAVVAVGLWVAMFESGVDPVISGLAVGLVTSAYPPERADLERATALTRSFREQPTPELARSAQQGLLAAISANERMQYELHPWVSYVVLPLFALSNAGLHLTGTLLDAAVSSPITLGIVVAYVVGKPVGIYAGSWVASRPSLHGPRPLVSGPVLAAGGACAGIGFTVSLLISSLAFQGQRLSEAKLGALTTLVLAPIVSWLAIRLIRRIPATKRARQIGRTAVDIPDLAEDVDPERDHVRGPEDALVTVLEYGDFECPYCGRAEESIRELLVSAGSDVRYVWRHLPLNDVHPRAQLAAEAAEAAAAQGRFWDMYDALLADQDALRLSDLERHAAELGLDLEQFKDDLHNHRHAARVFADVASADESGVSGTPTFFINGRRHYGVYDIDALTAAVRSAKGRLMPKVAA